MGGRPDGNGGSGALHVRAGGLVRAHHLKFFSNGALDIDNGSHAVAGLQIVGGSAPPAAGGTLGDMVVGLNTGGRMEISGGGTVTSARGYTGFNAGADAVTTVSGAGSRWNCSGSIWTGNAGTGALEITNGAVVTSTGNGYLGFSPGASGFVRVNGAGSSWTTALNVYVGGNAGGAGGSGTITDRYGRHRRRHGDEALPSGALNLGANATLKGLLTSLGGQIDAVADLTLVNNSRSAPEACASNPGPCRRFHRHVHRHRAGSPNREDSSAGPARSRSRAPARTAGRPPSRTASSWSTAVSPAR